MKRTIGIEGMGCAKCEAKVKKALEEIKGVSKVTVSKDSKNAVLEAEKNVSDDTLKCAVEEAGYTVTDIQ